jgi:hypothetical protein
VGGREKGCQNYCGLGGKHFFQISVIHTGFSIDADTLIQFFPEVHQNLNEEKSAQNFFYRPLSTVKKIKKPYFDGVLIPPKMLAKKSKIGFNGEGGSGCGFRSGLTSADSPFCCDTPADEPWP